MKNQNVLFLCALIFAANSIGAMSENSFEKPKSIFPWRQSRQEFLEDLIESVVSDLVTEDEKLMRSSESQRGYFSPAYMNVMKDYLSKKVKSHQRNH